MFLKYHNNFKGRCFMTYATKTFYKMVLSDFIRVSENTSFSERDVNSSMNRIECLNYHEVIEHVGIRFTCYNAGHVLGAAMFLFEVNGCKILYTGDYSLYPDRILKGAEVYQMI
jgi:cleavage and polyadenylation specificity factor subunit 3